MSELLRVQDVARILAVKEDRVYEMALAGQIPVIRVRRLLRFDPEAIKAWIEAGGCQRGAV